MNFIKLTDDYTNRPIFVNTDKIEYILENEDGVVKIQMSFGGSVYPAESYIDVTGQVAAIQNY